MTNALLEINRFGQNIWLDNLSRTHIKEGTLQKLIECDGISGLTSNPSIFHKAIAESPYYREDLARLKQTERDPERRYEALVIPDIQAACDLLHPVFEKSHGDNGYVSLEVSPRLAHDENTTVAEALRLAQAVSRDNLLVKVPGTPEGVRAFERLTAEGINVNVTLLFSLQHVVRVYEAYIRGLKTRMANGGDLHRSKAVASLFLSRVDTLIDKHLTAIGTDEALQLRGKAAVSMAKLTYQRYCEIFHGTMFDNLAQHGCRPQYALWASTGTKNQDYSDVLYVEPLIGTETVNTVPDATLTAFRDHGKVSASLETGVSDAREHYLHLERLGIDMNAAGEQLQNEGEQLFNEAYAKLLELVA